MTHRTIADANRGHEFCELIFWMKRRTRDCRGKNTIGAECPVFIRSNPRANTSLSARPFIDRDHARADNELFVII